jgi:hypothetical protein
VKGGGRLLLLDTAVTGSNWRLQQLHGGALLVENVQQVRNKHQNVL